MLPLYMNNTIDLPRVKGLDRAKAYQTQPNSRVAVFEDDDDIFYVIQTDALGNKTKISRYRFVEEPIENELDTKYASKKEISELKEMLEDVKQSISELAAAGRTEQPVVNTDAGYSSALPAIPEQHKSNSNVKSNGSKRS